MCYHRSYLGTRLLRTRISIEILCAIVLQMMAHPQLSRAYHLSNDHHVLASDRVFFSNPITNVSSLYYIFLGQCLGFAAFVQHRFTTFSKPMHVSSVSFCLLLTLISCSRTLEFLCTLLCNIITLCRNEVLSWIHETTQCAYKSD